jgi:hypothetical protein
MLALTTFRVPHGTLLPGLQYVRDAVYLRNSSKSPSSKSPPGSPRCLSSWVSCHLRGVAASIRFLLPMPGFPYSLSRGAHPASGGLFWTRINFETPTSFCGMYSTEYCNGMVCYGTVAPGLLVVALLPTRTSVTLTVFQPFWAPDSTSIKL